MRVTLAALTTNTTGVPVSLASWAVEWEPSASMPSNRPRFPSTTAMSLRPAARASAPRIAEAGIRNVSRLRAAVPAAAVSQAASM